MLTYLLPVCLVSVAVCNEMVQIGNQVFYLTPFPESNGVANLRPQNQAFQIQTDFNQIPQILNLPRLNVVNPNQEDSVPCQRAKLLINLLNNVLAIFTQTQNNIDNLSLSKVNSELDAIANNIKSFPLTQQNVEVYNKLKAIEANLLQIKTIPNNANGEPNMVNKLIFPNVLPNPSKPDCKKAFLKLIDIVQQAYAQLIRHPTCKDMANNVKPLVLAETYTNILPVAETLPYPFNVNNLLSPEILTLPNNGIVDSNIPASNYLQQPAQNLLGNIPFQTINGLQTSIPSNIQESNKPNIISNIPASNYIQQPVQNLFGNIPLQTSNGLQALVPSNVLEPNTPKIIGGLPVSPKAVTVTLINEPVRPSSTGVLENLQTVPAVPNLIINKEKSYGFPQYNLNLPIQPSLNVQDLSVPLIQANNLPNTKPSYEIYNSNVVQSPLANIPKLQLPNNIASLQSYPANNLPTILGVLTPNQANANFIPITNSPQNNKSLLTNQVEFPKLVLSQVNNNYQNPSSNVLELIGQPGSPQVSQYLTNGFSKPNPANVYLNQLLQSNNLQEKSFGSISSGKQNMNEDLMKQFLENAQFVNHKVNNENSKLFTGVTNPLKLDSTPDSKGLIELIYLLKRPNSVPYQQYYVVKYKLPYNSFLYHVKEALDAHPQFISNPESLYKETIPISDISELPQDLKDYSASFINNLVTRRGTFVKANIINNNDTFVDEQLNILKKLNKDVNVYDMLHILDKSQVNADPKLDINTILNTSNAGKLSKRQEIVQVLKDNERLN